MSRDISRDFEKRREKFVWTSMNGLTVWNEKGEDITAELKKRGEEAEKAKKAGEENDADKPE